MKRTIALPDLGPELRRLAREFPKAVEAGMRECAMLVGGQFVQDAIASSSPYLPVDRGQYKASFRTRRIAGGARVYNLSPQAVWIERGRRPGPVPLAPILAWVRRKGLADGPMGSAVRKGAYGMKRSVLASKKKRAAREQDAIAIARKIQRKIAAEGYAPRWPLRRALLRLTTGAEIHRIMRRHLHAAASGQGAA